MTRTARYLVLLAGVCLAVQADVSTAQKPAPGKKPVYDQYEPSKVRRTRKQECLRDEEPSGAYCVRLCQKGYVAVPNSNPPRCRSVEPLPPGSLPGPVRKETGSQRKPPGAEKSTAPSGKY